MKRETSIEERLKAVGDYLKTQKILFRLRLEKFNNNYKVLGYISQRDRKRLKRCVKDELKDKKMETSKDTGKIVRDYIYKIDEYEKKIEPIVRQYGCNIDRMPEPDRSNYIEYNFQADVYRHVIIFAKLKGKTLKDISKARSRINKNKEQLRMLKSLK